MPGIRRKTSILWASWLVAVALGTTSASISSQVPGDQTTDTPRLDPIPIRGSQIEGRLDAKVALVEFCDFEAYACARFASKILPALRARYISRGSVIFSFNHFPLESVHRTARLAAEMAACAGAGGAFWPVHDKFFAEPQPLQTERLRRILAATKPPLTAIDDCLKSRGPALVLEQMALGTRLRVISVPTFYLGPFHAGAVRPDDRILESGNPAIFAEAIQRALARWKGPI